MRSSCRHGLSTVRILSHLVCLGLLGCGQSQTQDPSNMMCVNRLQMPSYPALAKAAHLSIEVSAAFTLTTGGSIQSVVFEGATDKKPENQNLFLPTIEKTIRASTFEPACAQKTVRIRYVFRMDAAPDVTASWFGYPNRVEVWAVSPQAGY